MKSFLFTLMLLMLSFGLTGCEGERETPTERGGGGEVEIEDGTGGTP